MNGSLVPHKEEATRICCPQSRRISTPEEHYTRLSTPFAPSTNSGLEVAWVSWMVLSHSVLSVSTLPRPETRTATSTWTQRQMVKPPLPPDDMICFFVHRASLFCSWLIAIPLLPFGISRPWIFICIPLHICRQHATFLLSFISYGQLLQSLDFSFLSFLAMQKLSNA